MAALVVLGHGLADRRAADRYADAILGGDLDASGSDSTLPGSDAFWDRLAERLEPIPHAAVAAGPGVVVLSRGPGVVGLRSRTDGWVAVELSGRFRDGGALRWTGDRFEVPVAMGTVALDQPFLEAHLPELAARDGRR